MVKIVRAHGPGRALAHSWGEPRSLGAAPLPGPVAGPGDDEEEGDEDFDDDCDGDEDEEE
jgi:hypothetical protein